MRIIWVYLIGSSISIVWCLIENLLETVIKHATLHLAFLHKNESLEWVLSQNNRKDVWVLPFIFVSFFLPFSATVCEHEHIIVFPNHSKVFPNQKGGMQSNISKPKPEGIAEIRKDIGCTWKQQSREQKERTHTENTKRGQSLKREWSCCQHAVMSTLFSSTGFNKLQLYNTILYF